jgi:hypothetical protein
MGMSASELARLLGLHCVAWMAVRFLSPTSAKRAVDTVARLVPSFASEEEAEQGARALSAHGSCLTRAMTVAALLPGSEVAIGVDHSRSATLHAHAWVEVNGRPLGDTKGQSEGMQRMGSLARAGGRKSRR